MPQTLKILSAIVLCLAVSSAAVAQQGQQDQPQLTREQLQLLNSLPGEQRDALLRQFREQASRRVGMGDRSLDFDDPDQEALRREGLLPSQAEETEEVDPKLIQPRDTLVVDIRWLPGDPAQSGAGRSPDVLEGRHTVILDDQGRLSLPGLRDVPLAGLDGDQAALRLMAEPRLGGLFVLVTRLPLQATGRDALEPFGQAIFARSQDRLRSLYSMPVPANYRVGPGDTVQLNLFGNQSGEHFLIVGRDGRLQVPQLGPVAVANMRFDEMKTMIESRFREQTIGVSASVSMGELRSIEVFVLGDVQRPGNQLVSSLGTVLHALYASGGITDIGSLRDVRIIRGGEVAGRFDLYQLLLEGRPDSDIRLEAGDVVFVPSTGPRAGVVGETRRPAWYEMRGTQTLGDLLDYAGGATPDSDLRRAQVQRIDADGRPRFVDVDLSSPEGRAMRVRNGDVLVLNRITPRVDTAVQLRGHFNLTGARAHRAGLRVSDVIPDLSVLGENPDLDYALLVRQADDGRGIEVIDLSLRRVFASPGGEADPLLQPRDELVVFAFDDTIARREIIRDLVDRLRRQATRDTGARIANVAGAVRAPGEYPLTRDMRIADLVRAGGGLAQSAYLESAELTRFDVQNGGAREIRHIDVGLDRALQRDATEDRLLQPNDTLTIKQIPLWSDHRTVSLRGEVMMPGNYPVRPGETLAQVVERAGGLTRYAYPQAALLTRSELREKEQEQIDRMVQRLEADIAATSIYASADASAAQAQAVATSLAAQLRDTRAVGRLVIDLPRMLENPGHADLDVLAEAGDILIIPRRPQEVTIVGEVYFPTSHLHEADLHVREYLERSGGLTQRADGRRIYIVRANGSVDTVTSRRNRRGSSEVHPGDTIVVPLDAERMPLMMRLSQISQIVYQLGVAAAAWQTIGVF
jgi:polysaccharide biosynthesis/export protein